MDAALSTEAPQDQVITEEGTAPAEAVGFFEDEQVSENELRGIDEDPATEEETAETSGLEEETASTPSVDDAEGTQDDDTLTAETTTVKDDEKSGDEEKAGDDVKPEAPPKGFVPYQALNEERGKRRELSQKVADLEADLEEAQARVKDDSEEAFKVLSDDEFDEMVEENPAEALRYQRKLERYKDDTRRVDAKTAEETNLVNIAAARIQEIVPGIYDEGSKVGSELAEFAIEKGFDPDALQVLTDPRTKIIPHDGKGSTLLAAGAASVINMINTLKSQGAGAQSERAAIRAELLKEVTAEVMTKLKAGGATVPPSINDLPGNSEGLETKILSEADIARLSDADRAKYLGG